MEERKLEFPVEERKHIKNYKVGHAGTLDPLATGLLVICTGKFTKRISEIQEAEKEYTGTITIGAVTESFDLEKSPENFLPFTHITDNSILETAEKFIGFQMQNPPIHSAKKIDGQRAYDKARKGEEFTLKPNGITIIEFEILSISLPEINFRIVCSKGTYIRSIAHDFGKILGAGAYLSTLCRTRIGNYLLKDALSPENFLLQVSDKQSL